MNPTSPSTDELFLEARELDGGGREDFLAKLPEPLANELRQLLAADEAAEAQGLFESIGSVRLSDAGLTVGIDDGSTDDLTYTAPYPRGEGAELSRIGPYKILHSIGVGGMGQVFMAEQQQPVKRRVALKVIRTQTPTREILARFESERQAIAMMDHQNIARVLDAGMTDDGRPYFAMELVRGIPITQYCDQNRLTLDERLNLFVQTCRAIQHAHQKGIIHRDIKPSNVLITQYDGVPVAKVIDFGLAKALQDEVQLTDRTMFTQCGQVVGTLAYMSPEQAEMNSLDVDTRTDVYSLGVMLYELLTGSTPISSDRLKREAFDRILASIREEDAPRPSSRLSESADTIQGISAQRRVEPRRLSLILRGDLDWIVMKALDKDRARRYDTPAALADDIQRYLNHEAIEARPPSYLYRMRKSFRRHRTTFLAGIAVVVLLVAGLLGTGSMYLKARAAGVAAVDEAEKAWGARIRERQARIQVEAERDRVKAAQEQTESTLARSNYFLSIARWDADRTLEATRLLDRVPPQYRNFEWWLARREFTGSLVTCYGHHSAVSDIDVSPDGTRIASASWDTTVRVWDLVTGDELGVLKGHTRPVSSVRFSDDGNLLVTSGFDGTVRIWDWAQSKSLQTLTGHTGAVSCAEFSPDAARVVSGGRDRTIRVWDSNSGELLRVLDSHRSPVHDVCFSPSGKYLLSGSWDSTARLWDAATGEELWLLAGHANPVYAAQFSPDEKHIATGSWDRTIRIWDIGSRETLKVIEGGLAEVRSVRFSPDGLQLVAGTGGFRDPGRLLLFDLASGERLRTLQGHTHEVSSVRFSTDGSLVVSGSSDGTVKVWSTESSAEHRIHRGHRGRVMAVGFTPDGVGILSAGGSPGRRGELSVRNRVTGEARFSPPPVKQPIQSADFNSSGREIVTAGYDGSVRVFDSETGAELTQLSGHDANVTAAVFSPDGSLIASGGEDQTIRVWDRATGEQKARTSSPGRVVSLDWSPDGRLIAATVGQLRGTAPNAILLLDAATLELRMSLEGHEQQVNSVQFSEDSRRLVTASNDRTVRMWDAESGRQLQVYRGHAHWVMTAALSPDGSRVVSGGWDSTIRIWDAETSEELRSLGRHDGPIMSVRFSRCGHYIASGSYDSTVRVWNARRVRETRTLTGHREPVQGIHRSADGTRMFSRAGHEKFVWDTETGERIVGAEWNEEPARGPAEDSSTRWQAIPAGRDILLIDRSFRSDKQELTERRIRLKSPSTRHHELLTAASRQQQWFAVAFHATHLLRARPELTDLADTLEMARGKLGEETAALLPASQP